MPLEDGDGDGEEGEKARLAGYGYGFDAEFEAWFLEASAAGADGDLALGFAELARNRGGMPTSPTFSSQSFRSPNTSFRLDV